MEIIKKIEDYLSHKLNSKVAISNFKSLSAGGGACQDNYSLDLKVESGEFAGEHPLVFRTDKGGSLYASLPKQYEFGVASMAYNAGVKTPRPYWLEPSTEVTGNPFYMMERIEGKANGRFVIKDACLNAFRKSMPDVIAENLVKIHSVTPDSCKDSSLNARLDRTGIEPKKYAYLAVQELRGELANLKESHPALELCLNWAEKTSPECDQIVLVHGDFRTGNFMVSANGLHGIIDWEFAHWGDRHEDISWLCLRDWRFGKLNKEVGGFGDRKEFYESYEKYSKILVDPEKVRFWEVIGNIRWAIGAAGQAERHISGKDKGIELASIGRRVCEMEYEAMRLIENAR